MPANPSSTFDCEFKVLAHSSGERWPRGPFQRSFGEQKSILYEQKSIFREQRSIFREQKSIFREQRSIFREQKSIFRQNVVEASSDGLRRQMRIDHQPFQALTAHTADTRAHRVAGTAFASRRGVFKGEHPTQSSGDTLMLSSRAKSKGVLEPEPAPASTSLFRHKPIRMPVGPHFLDETSSCY